MFHRIDEQCLNTAIAEGKCGIRKIWEDGDDLISLLL